MEEIESSTLWIVRCITALLLLRKQLDKPFREAKKEDIKKLLKWIIIFVNLEYKTDDTSTKKRKVFRRRKITK